jgi:hypothetical protein
MVILRQVMGDVQTSRERKRNLLRAPTVEKAPYEPAA